MQLLINALIAWCVTMGCIYLLRPLAIRLGLVDIPGGRKSHSGHIPVIGGVSMFIGFVASVLFLPTSLLSYRAFFIGSGLLVFVGFLDDFNEMSARLKLVLQILAALIMIYVGGVALFSLGDLFFLGDLFLPAWLSSVVTVIAALGVMNAVNMVDGVDGLAGTLVLVALGFLFYLAWQEGLQIQNYVLIALMTALLAYLQFNFPFYATRKASVFMGDAGSLFLGFALVWHLISFSQSPIAAAQPVTFLWFIAVPLFDATTAILRRLKKRKSPFSPDAKHLHHLLKHLGCSKTVIVLLLGFFAVLIGVIGLVLDRSSIPGEYSFLAYIVLYITYVGSVHSLWKRVTKNHRG